MDTIVFCTDTHFRNSNPSYRRDEIFKNSLEEFKYVLDVAKENNALLIHGGDIFHTPNATNEVVSEVAELIVASGVRVALLVGNHDLIGSNIDTLRRTAGGLLRFCSDVVLLHRNAVRLNHTIIYGIPFSKENEVPTEVLSPQERTKDYVKADYTIVVVHSMITDQPEIIVNNSRRSVNPNNIVSSADIVLSGHYHPGFGKIKTKQLSWNTTFVNPGSMGRMTIEDAKRRPKYAIIRIENGISIKIKKIPFNKAIFDLDSFQQKKEDKENKNRFKEMLENVDTKDFFCGNITKQLNDMNLPDFLKNKTSQGVVERCVRKIAEVENG
jgi:DNA repair exonuclease SbcCD nuclease subunit